MDITPEFIKTCIRDDRKAIKQLYEYCFRALMPVCFRYNKNEEDARAAFHTGFIKILKGMEKMEGDVNFNAWMKRVMVNSLIDEYRKNKKYNEQITKSDSDRELDYHSNGHLNDAESNLGCENIMRLLDEIPESSALVFKMYVIEGYSHKDIADKLGMSEGTSKWHLSTARKLLRDKLEKIEERSQRLVI